MTLDEIKAFVAIAESGSFTKASDQLHRSQPAVSRRIDLMESSLGATLFARHGRHTTLTEVGEALLPHAQAALAAVLDGESAVRNLLENSKAELRVAVVGTIADNYLVDALRAFQSEFTDAKLDLQTANSLDVTDFVRRSDATIGLRYHDDPDPQLEITLLGAERRYVVVPSDHSVKSSRVKSLKPFALDRWLGFPTSGKVRASLNEALREQFIADVGSPPQTTLVDSLTAQKRLVEAGFGIALMPKRNLREELASGKLRIVEVASLTAQIPVALIRRKGGVRRKSENALVTHLREHIPAMLDS